MDQLLRAFTQVWKGFNSLPGPRKISILAAVAISVIGIMTLVYVSNTVDYKVLFSNLSSEDAGNIVSKLQEKKIPYKVSAAGDSIMVPQEKVSELRLELAAAGLPQGGGVGFEIFDNKSLGVTEFVQQLNYQRALQGELSRTINGLDEIQHSRVHIAIPKKSLFAEDQKKATASVILKLKAGRTLRPSSIDGIVHLVASSIEGLNPGDVMVVDSSGKVLSKIQDDSKMGRMSNSQIEYQRNIEKDLTNRLQSMLERVVGTGKAVVRVTADLDFRIMEKLEEKFDPEAQVVRSQQRQSERSGMQAGAQAAPVPGAPAAGAPGQPGAKAEPKQEKLDEIINYEINKTVNKTVMPVGEIKKLSIAVLVDGIYVKNDKGVEQFQPRPKKEISDLEELVKKSAGFDAKREDQVVVTSIPFTKGDLDEDQMKPSFGDRMAQFYPIIKYVLLMAVLALVVFFFLRPLVKSLVTRGRMDGMRDGWLPVRVTSPGLKWPQACRAEALPRSCSRAQTVPAIGHDMKSYAETDMVKQLATADARKFADLLRHWLK